MHGSAICRKGGGGSRGQSPLKLYVIIILGNEPHSASIARVTGNRMPCDCAIANVGENHYSQYVGNVNEIARQVLDLFEQMTLQHAAALTFALSVSMALASYVLVPSLLFNLGVSI